MLYHVLPLIVAAFAFRQGYRKGIIKQIPKLIGFCFGIVCAHLFALPVEESLRVLMPSVASKIEGEYIYSVLATGLVYLTVYGVLNTCTQFLNLIFRKRPEILGSLAGSLFCFVRYMLLLSVFYNLWLGLRTNSDLMKYAKTDDGNIVELVMLISPAILGGESVEELAHTLQLEEAKTIS